MELDRTLSIFRAPTFVAFIFVCDRPFYSKVSRLIYTRSYFLVCEIEIKESELSFLTDEIKQYKSIR